MTSATASIQFVSSANGVSTWKVVGHATYADQGLHTVSVTVNDVGGSAVSTTQTSFNVTLAGFVPTNPGQLYISAPSSNGFFRITANGTNLSVYTGSVPGPLSSLTSLGTFTFSPSNQIQIQPTVANATLEIDGGATDSINITSSAGGAINGTPVSFSGVSSLNVNGNAVLGTAGSPLTGFSTLTVSGNATLNSDVTTTGAEQFGGAVTLNADAVLNAGSVEFDGPVTGARALTVTSSGPIQFNAPVGTPSQRLQRLVTNGTGTAYIGASVYTAGDPTFNTPVVLTGASTISDTGTGIYFYSTLDSGATAQALTLDTSGATPPAPVVFGGPVGGSAALASLAVTASGAIQLNGGSVKTTGAQSYAGAVALGANTALTGSAVTFGGTVAGGDHGLTVNGNAVLGGEATGLANLSVTGTAAIKTDKVSSSGAQDYAGAVTLNSNTTLTASTVTTHAAVTDSPDGTVTWLKADGDANDAVSANNGTLVGGATFGPGVSGTPDSAFSFNGTSAYVQVPDSPSLTPTSLTLDAWVNPDSLSSGGADQGLGRVILSKYDSGPSGQGQSWIIQEFSGGKVRFVVYQTVAGSVVYHGIDTVNPVLAAGAWQHVAGTFDAASQQMVIYVNGAAVASTLIAGSGTVTATARTTTPVRIGTAVNYLGNLVEFWQGRIDEPAIYSRALSAAEIQTIDGLQGAGKGGGHSLAVSGNAVLGGEVTALGSLSVSGTTTVATDAVSTTGGQTYSGPVSLTHDVTLTGGGVEFDQPVNGAQALAITSSGPIRVNAPLGLNPANPSQAQALKDVEINGTGTTYLGGSIQTTGDPIFGNTVLTGDETISSSGAAIQFTGTVDSDAIATPRALTLDTLTGATSAFPVQLGGVGGGTAPLASLTISSSGTTQINGGAVTTTGAQTYNDAVTLGAGTILTSTGPGDISFGSTLDGTQDLTLSAAGNITVSGQVGSQSPLTSLTISSAADATFRAVVNTTTSGGGTGNLTQTAGTGTTTLSGGSIAGALSITTGAVAINTANLSVTGSASLDVGGAVTEGTGGTISAPSLTTTSGAGTSLGNNNAVASFSATDTGGSVSLTNTATTLTVTGISEAGGGITVSNTGAVSVTGTVSASSGGAVSLTASGALAESGAGLVSTAGTLTTASAGGTSLGGANTVGTFNATDSGGSVSLTNTAPTLTVSGATETGGGGITVTNTGAVSVTGTVSAGSGGAVSLTASGALAEGTGGLVSTAGTLTTSSSGGTSLGGANTVSTFHATDAGGSVSLTNTAATLTVSGASETGAGSISVSNTGAVSVTGSVATGSGAVNLTASGALAESGAGLVSTAGTLTTSSAGGAALGGANAVGTFNASDSGGSVGLTNTAATLTVSGASETGGGGITVTNAGAVSLSGNISAAGAGAITVTASNGAITMAPAATTANGTGAIRYTAATSVALGALSTGGNVSVTGTAGAISDATGGTGTNITALSASLTAGAGIGTSADPLATVLSDLAASGGSGGVWGGC